MFSSLMFCICIYRKEVGEAVSKSGIARKDIFVTTKVIAPPESKDPEETYQMLVKAVEKFGLGESQAYCFDSAAADMYN